MSRLCFCWGASAANPDIICRVFASVRVRVVTCENNKATSFMGGRGVQDRMHLVIADIPHNISRTLTPVRR